MGFNRSSTSDDELGGFITTDTYNFGFGITYLPNSKLSFSASPRYTLTVPESGNLSERENISFSVSSRYIYSSKLSLRSSASYTHSETDGINAVESESYTLSGGVSGTLLPKVTGSVSAGASFRAFAQGTGTSATPFASVGLNWATNSLTSVSFSARRSFGTSLSNNSSVNTSFSTSVRRTINKSLSGNITGTITLRELESQVNGKRNDENYSISTGLDYKLRKNMGLGLSVRYVTQDSDVNLSNYDRVVVSTNLNLAF